MIYKRLYNFPSEIIRDLRSYYHQNINTFEKVHKVPNDLDLFVEHILREDSQKRFVLEQILGSKFPSHVDLSYMQYQRLNDPSKHLHRDKVRNTALNIPIETDPKLGAFFIAKYPGVTEWDESKIEKVPTDYPILFNAHVHHSMMNATDRDRIIFSISFIEEKIDEVIIPEEWL